MRRGRSFDLITVHDGDFTVTFGVFKENGKYVPFAGASKRSHEDHMNHKRGENIAMGRAFKNLGRNLLRQEFELIHQNRKPEPKICTPEVEKPKREVFAVLPKVKKPKKKDK